MKVSSSYEGGSPADAMSYPVRLHFLRSIGSPGRDILRSFTRGSSGWVLRVGEKNKRGQYTVRSKVIGSSKIRFTMPPGNFFENGLTRRDGRKSSPSNIFKTKFPTMLNSNLQAIVDGSWDRIIQPELDKI